MIVACCTTDRKFSFLKLSHITRDLLAVPASQAYVKRIFSALGILSNDKATHMDKSLEICMDESERWTTQMHWLCLISHPMM